MNLLEWLSVCQLATEMMLFWKYDFTYHLSRIYQSGVKPCNKIMQECRWKNEHTKWQCSEFFCRTHWIYLGYFNSFILFFSPPCHENVCLYFGGTLDPALCLAFMCAKSFVCYLLDMHIREFWSVHFSPVSFHDLSGKWSHSIKLFYFSRVIGTLE